MPDYDRGVLDGFEIALRMHEKQFAQRINDLAAARRAAIRFRAEARSVLDTIRTHQLREVAAYYGLDDAAVPERMARLRAMLDDDTAEEILAHIEP